MKVKGRGQARGVKRQGKHANTIIAGQRAGDNNHYTFAGYGDLVQGYDPAI